jgi:hypothetical protein
LTPVLILPLPCSGFCRPGRKSDLRNGNLCFHILKHGRGSGFGSQKDPDEPGLRRQRKDVFELLLLSGKSDGLTSGTRLLHTGVIEGFETESGPAGPARFELESQKIPNGKNR